MCGIAGYWGQRPVEDQAVRAMVEALVHRGPDAAGFHQGTGFTGGMRRLSINDPAHGDQPLFNQAGDVALFYNGEIYNYPELRHELEAQGARLRTHCDGEVICHLYDRLGEDLFGRLDGMFAAALWDERRRRLILARDIPGEKPLYYAEPWPGGLVFASETKALARFPGLSLRLDDQALWDFPTFLWVPEPATAFREVRALPRGHLLIADERGVRTRRYEHVFAPQAPAGDEEMIAETRRVVTRAVQSRLLSDVPVGAFLSSGLDSSIVATLASRALPRLDTFTVGFADLSDPYHGRADESVLAEAYARRLGTRHHTIRVEAGDLRRDLIEFCEYGDQPWGVSSGLGVLAVARAARAQGIKVLLTGDGADEMFGGYSWYFHLNGRPPRRRPHDDRPGISCQDVGLPEAARLQVLAGYSPSKRAWAWHYYASEEDKRGLLNLERFAGAQSSLRHFAAFKDHGDWSPEDYIRQDREFYFPNEMLRKADRMTMAHSVEGRVPFAAPAVLALAQGLGYGQAVRGGELKWALRRAFADLLPPEVVARPKHGFNVPVDTWLKDEWADLLDQALDPGSELGRRNILAPGARQAARRMLAQPTRLCGHTLFCLITLNLWLEAVARWR